MRGESISGAFMSTEGIDSKDRGTEGTSHEKKGTREGIDDTDRKDTFMRIEGTTVQTRDREGTDGTSATSTEGTFMRQRALAVQVPRAQGCI